jgi:signal transduction histidine kinase
MAAAGWAMFFPLIADYDLSSVAALPLWTATAGAVGWVSYRLVASERARTRAEMDAEAAHRLRTPVAVIHSMAQTLRRDELSDEQREKLLELIEHDSGELLRGPPFEQR